MVKELTAGYVRISVDRNHDKVSDDQQKNAIQRFIEEKQLTFFRFYEDLDVSGGDMVNRLGFDQLLEEIEKYNIKNVVFYDLSRYTRNIVDYFNMTIELQKKGVKLFSTEEREAIDLVNWNDSSTNYTFKALINHMNLAKVKKDVSNAMKLIAQSGLSVGGPPPFAMTKVEVQTSKGMKKKFAPGDPEKVELVKLIYKMYVEDKMTTLEIVKHLNDKYPHLVSQKIAIKFRKDPYYTEEGVQSMWNHSTVRRVLCNPLYTGYMVSRRRVRENKKKHIANAEENWVWSYNFQNGLEPDFETIIPYDYWKKAQEIRLGRNKKKGKIYEKKRDSSLYLLSGLLHCGCCKRKMVGKPDRKKNGKQYFFYACKTPWSAPDVCDNKSLIQTKDVDKEVMKIFGNTMNIFNLLKYIRSTIEEEAKSQGDYLKQVTQIDSRISVLSEQQETLIGRLSDPELKVKALIDKFYMQINKMEEDIQTLKDEKEELLNSKGVSKKIDFKELVGLLLKSPDYLDRENAPIIRRHLEQVVERVILDKEQITIRLKIAKKVEVTVLQKELYNQKLRELSSPTGRVSKQKIETAKDAYLIRLLATMWDKYEFEGQEAKMLDLVIRTLEMRFNNNDPDDDPNGGLPLHLNINPESDFESPHEQEALLQGDSLPVSSYLPECIRVRAAFTERSRHRAFVPVRR
ncbi:recombinase family protein [Paenibacillus contaminans]|uniref:Recombinase family protein n=1 Tax=Paenibacillus contaminans TaxID=450362 RepID=A0A329MSW0_9BACL|nr:recombinase family protein [Paenibacillus contaminans]RAV22642.1 hypothetical protein DQG23_00025 [Paenibacillus contaminans]